MKTFLTLCFCAFLGLCVSDFVTMAARKSMNTDVHDGNGKLVGRISGGIVYDASGKRLGWTRSGNTYNSSGKILLDEELPGFLFK